MSSAILNMVIDLLYSHNKNYVLEHRNLNSSELIGNFVNYTMMIHEDILTGKENKFHKNIRVLIKMS